MAIRLKIKIKRPLSEQQCERLKTFFQDGAAKFDPEPECWIHGWNEGESFCTACAEKKVEELLKEEPGEEYHVDGGWGSELDSTPFCQTCDCLLDASLTDYGAESEIEHFLGYGFDVESDDDRRAMHEVLQTMGWETAWDYWESEYKMRDAGRRYKDLHHLGRIILNALGRKAEVSTAETEN